VLAGQQLEQDGAQGVDVVGAGDGGAGQALGRDVAAHLPFTAVAPGAGRELAQAGGGLEPEQAGLAFVGDHHQMRHHEAVQHALVLHARLVGGGEGEGDAFGDQEGMVGRNGRELPAGLGDQRREVFPGDVVVGRIGVGADAFQVHPVADVRALEGVVDLGAAGDLVPQLVAVQALAVENAEQDDLLHPLLAPAAGAKRLSERIFSQLFEKQILPKLLRDVH
jgi:hypothetical protein